MTTKRSLAVVLAAVASWSGLAAQTPAPLEARLARAALLETQGDVAGAEQELIAAAKAADAARADEVDAALRALRQRSGRGAPSQVQDPVAKPAGGVAVGDPIQALLATIERGSDAKHDVATAMKELRALGVLAVPHLCAALPKLGPFGARNAATLFYELDDPRILPALRQRVADGDAAFAAMLASDFGKMPRSWSAAMARDLATRDLPAKARLGVLQALVAAGAEEGEWQPLLDSLAPATDLHQDLLAWFRISPALVRPRLLTLLQESPAQYVRASAVTSALLDDPRCDEDRALQALDRLSAEYVPSVAVSIAERHPSWVRVGLRAIGPDTFVGNSSWFLRMEWWRRPQEAAPVLLNMAWPEEYSTDPMKSVFEGMVASGWRLPPGLDEKFRSMIARASGERHVMVLALPEDDEARALAMWDGLGAFPRRFFVSSLVAAGRPWHRVVLAQIAATASTRDVNPEWVERDWTGLTEADGRTFVAEVTRLVANGNGVAYSWNTALAKACTSQTALPVGLLLPMVRAGQVAAFQALVERDAAVAFAEVANAQILGSPMEMEVLKAIAKHGDKRQLPLAIRLFRANPGNGTLDKFFETHCAGEQSVIELGKAPWPDRGPVIAAEAAKGIQAENYVAVLAMLPDLAEQVAQAVMSPSFHGIGFRMSEEHRRKLRAAIEAQEPRLMAPSPSGRMPATTVMHVLVASLGAWGQPEDMDLLRRIGAARPESPVAHSVAEAMLRLAGTDRRAVLTELLDSKIRLYVQEALQADELRTDAELRQRALTASLALGRDLDGSPLFKLAPADALVLAKVIAEHPDFATFHPTLVDSTLHVLGNAKDKALVGLILRGAKHADERVRRSVVHALGNTFTEAAAQALLEFLRDEDDTTRRNAKERLDQIGEYLDARAKWDARKK